MASEEKQTVRISSRIAKYIGSKAAREKKLEAATMQAEFTLHDTLVILCYLGRDQDPEIASNARKNLIPAARKWYSREVRPELPAPIEEIVLKIIQRIGEGKEESGGAGESGIVRGNIGLLGLAEIIQTVDHNNRTVSVTLENGNESAVVYMVSGKVAGAVCGDIDGLEALHRMFGWADAPFIYTHGPPGDFDNKIQVNTLNLIMDALEYCPDVDPFESEAAFEWEASGDLATMNIFEIAEIFEMNAKQCVCNLARNDESGVLYFNQGRIINADLKDMSGMDAACHLLAWPNARFSVKRGGGEVEEVIHVGMQNLIIEAMRLLDEGVTVTDDIASELAQIDELFDGQDVSALPVMEKVRLVFGDNEAARENLEADTHPLVRKAVKVKISKTVHRYLSADTDHDLRMAAARGAVALSTTEKLVLLSYLSHDEIPEIKETALRTLERLDMPTFRKGLGSNLHPAVMDFLVRETIRDESIVKVACQSPDIQEDTALHILEKWPGESVLTSLAENPKLLERSPTLSRKLYEKVADNESLRQRIDLFERGQLDGAGDVKVEGPLWFYGLRGLTHAASEGARTGTIVVDGFEDTGYVFFNSGKILGATYGSKKGGDALAAMLENSDVRFRYILRTHIHEENIDHAAADDLLRSVKARPSRVEDSKAGLSFVTGSLAAMDIYEVLSGLEGSPTPVRVAVTCEEGSGEIYRDATRVLHCHVDGKEGPLKSMAALMSWAGHRFIVSQAAKDFPVSLDKTVPDFFTEALKEVPEEAIQTKNPGQLPEWELSEAEYESLYFKILEMGVAEKIKLAMLGSKEARGILVRDPIKLVAVAAVKSPKIQLSEIETISKSRSVCDDVLRTIAGAKEWMKSYTVKHNLVCNSKTPLPITMRLLPHIRELDLRKLARNKNIPAALSAQARRMLDTKRKPR